MTPSRLEELRQIAGGIDAQKSAWLDELIAEVDRLHLQVAALQKALYAECYGSACDVGNCYGGYRECSGCERRAKEAYGPGWGDVTEKKNPECTCTIDGTPYCKAKGTGFCLAENQAEKRKCPYNHSDHQISGFLPVQNCPNCSSPNA